MPRKPSQIAFDILSEMSAHLLSEMNAYLLSNKCKPGKIPTWITHAKPYITAMLELRSIKDRYYLDSGYEICLRARRNLTNWRGERAKALKAELDDLLKSCPESKHL